MKISIVSRSGKELVPGGITVSDEASVEDLQKAFHEKKRKLHPARQRFTIPSTPEQKGKPTVLAAGTKLKAYNITDGSSVVFKDLGPQVGYRTVFFYEYFGPLVVYAAIFFLPGIVYPSQRRIPEKTLVQKLALLYWSFHYIKRILESAFLHRFSHATMPLRNLFKNCSYYWGFAAYVSYFVNHPLYTEPPEGVAIVLLLIATSCQFCNLKCHIILANLRPKGGATGYVIPKGFFFDYITCPNYTFEILAWTCFSVATSCLPAILFTVAGALQMLQWAIGKHTRLRKIYDGKEERAKYPRRWIMLPPII